MADSAAPNGWYMVDGAWGVDADIDTTTYLTGQASLHLPNVASSSAVLYSDWIQVADISVSGLSATAAAISQYRSYVVSRGSSSAAGKTVRIVLQGANAAKSSISTVTTVKNTGYATGGYWEVSSGNTTMTTGIYWVRFKIDRPIDTDFDVYIDRVHFGPQPPFGILLDLTGTLTSGAWTLANHTTGSQNMMLASTTTDRITTVVPGMYSVCGHIMAESGTQTLSDGNIVGLRILHYSGATLQYSKYNMLAAGAAINVDWGVSVSGEFYMAQGDYVVLQYYANVANIDYDVIELRATFLSRE